MAKLHKCILSLLSFFFITSPGFSQSWIEDGAEWYYEWTGVSSVGYEHMWYASDTAISGTMCKELKVTSHAFYTDQNDEWKSNGESVQPSIFVAEKGDTLFRWFNNKFYVLYDMSASVGTLWNPGYLSGRTNCQDLKVVTNKDTSVNSRNYKMIQFRPWHEWKSGVQKVDMILKGIDPLEGTFIPTEGICDSSIITDMPAYRLRCYKSSSTSEIKFIPQECNYPLSKVGISDLPSAGISIYPNPVSNHLNIDLKGSSASWKWEISSFNGSVVLADPNLSSTENTSIQIPISSLTKGLYYITFTNSKGVSVRSTFVKE